MTYLKFEELPVPAGYRTKRWRVSSARDGSHLGGIGWHPPWRRYVLYINGPCVWDAACLAECTAFLAARMQEHKA